jgi:hypothetical protein
MTHENEAAERDLDEEQESAREAGELPLHPDWAGEAVYESALPAAYATLPREALLRLWNVGKDGSLYLPGDSPTPVAQGETVQFQLTAQRRTLPERVVVGAELNDLVIERIESKLANGEYTHSWLDVGGTFTVTVRALKNIENVRIMVGAQVGP